MIVQIKAYHRKRKTVVFDDKIPDTLIEAVYPGYEIEREEQGMIEVGSNVELTKFTPSLINPPNWSDYHVDGLKLVSNFFSVSQFTLKPKQTLAVASYVLPKTVALKRTGKPNVIVTAYHVANMGVFSINETNVSVPAVIVKTDNARTSIINYNPTVRKVEERTLVISIPRDIGYLEYDKVKISEGEELAGVVSGTDGNHGFVAPYQNFFIEGEKLVAYTPLRGEITLTVTDANVSYGIVTSYNNRIMYVEVEKGVEVNKPFMHGESGSPVFRRSG
ncbi:hypothetical protein [Metallosphaera sp.]|uniref:hypothetical protein n=1 Tax=Metallosphaera sp. TaxID=2020860 RepID=UPI0031630B8D